MAVFVRRFLPPIAVGIALWLALAACRPRPAPGVSCTQTGRYLCMDASTALYCDKGHYRAIACRGKKGCAGGTSSPSCDTDLAVEGEDCMQGSQPSHSCDRDTAGRALSCKDGKWALHRLCRGPLGCRVEGTTVRCDTTVASAGDGCSQTGTMACSVDRRLVLVCSQGKLEPDAACRGPLGCQTTEDGETSCDETLAREGDLCNLQDWLTCSEDRKFELICKKKRFVVKQACKSPSGCQPRKGQPPLCL